MDINLEQPKLRLSPSIPMNRKKDISNFLQISLSSNLGTYLGYKLKPSYKSSDFEDNFKTPTKITELGNTSSFFCWLHSVNICNTQPNSKLRNEDFYSPPKNS